MRMRIAGDVLRMGRWARVLVLMPALKTAGAAREALLVAYIAPGQGEMGRERRVLEQRSRYWRRRSNNEGWKGERRETGEVDWIMQLRK